MRGLLIGAGLTLVVLGLLWPWLGHLPGDLRFGRGGARIYLPLGTSVLLSILASIVLTLVSWFMRR